MNTRRVLISILAAVALSTPLLAGAQNAQTSKWVNVRAGPAREYPVVTQLSPATLVTVQGCLSDYSWCDILAYGNVRGWVWSGNLLYLYQNAPVPIVTYGPRIGLPIISFILGAYWADHYRDRSWYRDWRNWDSWHRDHYRPAPNRPAPPPHQPDFRRPGRPPAAQAPSRPRSGVPERRQSQPQGQPQGQRQARPSGPQPGAQPPAAPRSEGRPSARPTPAPQRPPSGEQRSRESVRP